MWTIGISAIAVVAFVVRVLYVQLVARHVALGFDAVWYTLVSGPLAHGKGFVDPQTYFTTGRRVATAAHAPLYPAFLAVVTRMVNSHRDTFQLFGAAAGTLTVVCTGFVGRRIGGNTVGLIAAALAAAYPSLIAVDGSLMSETITIPLLTAMVWLALVTIEKPTWWRYALLGVIGGLGALARPDVLLAAAFVIVAAVVAPTVTIRRFASAGIAVVALLVVVSPWLLRSAARVDTPTLATTSTAQTVSGANCATTYRGTLIGYWDSACVNEASRGTLSEASWSGKQTRQGIRYAAGHVMELPLVVGVRELRAFGLFNPRQQARLEAIETRSYHWQLLAWVLWLPVFALGIYGLIRLARSQGRAALPLFAIVAATVLTVALSYGNQRFRTSCEPAFLVGTGVALAELRARVVGQTEASVR
jgi:4-amino-4-deoxy-L-arabinose transferase-like glycosyltransferase